MTKIISAVWKIFFSWNLGFVIVCSGWTRFRIQKDLLIFATIFTVGDAFILGPELSSIIMLICIPWYYATIKGQNDFERYLRTYSSMILIGGIVMILNLSTLPIGSVLLSLAGVCLGLSLFIPYPPWEFEENIAIIEDSIGASEDELKGLLDAFKEE